MSLPDKGAAWPPPALRPALDKMDEWSAWWAGSTDRLESMYENGRGPIVRPSQFNGGALGTLSRMWWGRPPAVGEPASKLHVPLGADICRTSGRMLFGEPITVTADDPAASAHLGELFDQHAQGKLREAAERGAALGGVFMRAVADPSLRETAWLDSVSPVQALPEWRWGVLKAVTFWSVVHRGDDLVMRHLERHEPGRILHGLYVGDDGSLGRPVPLTEHDATRGIADLVDEDGAIDTGHDRLTAAYIPNMRPAPLWEDNPLLEPYGRSDLDGIESILDALDETYSSLMRDVRLSKGRIIVADTMLDDQGPGRGAKFDPDREAYAVVNGLPKDVPLTVQQFDIRVEKLSQTAHEWLTIALRRAGIALITLGEVEGGQAITATEVKAKGQLSFMTLGEKRGFWTPALEQDLIPALVAVDAAAFPDRPAIDLTGLAVGWPDSVSDDLATLAATVETLHRAEAASIERRVRIVNPDMGDEEVREEVRLIREEIAAGEVTVAPFDDEETADLRNGPPPTEDDEDDEGPAEDLAEDEDEAA